MNQGGRWASLVLLVLAACGGSGPQSPRWSIQSGPAVDAYQVWASGPRDAWAVGPNTLAHWDGRAWKQEKPNLLVGASYERIVGSGPKDLWVAGSRWNHSTSTPVLMHYDGASWSDAPALADFGYLFPLNGAPGETWVMGRRSTSNAWALARWDGGAWSIDEAASAELASKQISGLWVGGPLDIWAIADGVALHWDGTAWSSMSPPEPPPGSRRTNVWASSPDDVWFAAEYFVEHWNGTGWSRSIDLPEYLRVTDLRGSGPNDVWLVGQLPRIEANSLVIPTSVVKHWDGAVWSDVTPPDHGLNVPVVVTSVAPNDVWLSGNGVVDHWDGKAWSTLVSEGTALSARAITGTGAKDVWAAGQSHGWPTLEHWNGTAWSATVLSTGIVRDYATIVDVWASGPDDAWAVGNTNTGAFVLRWDGTHWSRVDPDEPLLNWALGVWGKGPDDVWAFGNVLVHWDGVAWTKVEPPGMASPTFSEVWASSSDSKDLWVFGVDRAEMLSEDFPVVWHWDGGSWSVSMPPFGAYETLSNVWGSSDHDVWAVCGFREVCHGDGISWTRDPSPLIDEDADIRAIWGSAADDVWAVGRKILHYDGVAWTEDTAIPKLPATLTAVWGNGAGDAWAVGEDGIVVRLR